MCGINVTFKDSSQIERMNQKLSHRGLSSSFEKIDKALAIGHVRLPIQGLDPKYGCPYEIAGVKYLFNGEIFNYKELNPKAESDVQVLNKDPAEFDGDFAIVKLLPNNTVKVITDSLGKRQLYYREEFGKITKISSEIKALVEKGDTLDMYYLSTSARFGYFLGRNITFVKKIKRFNQGTEYTIDKEGKIINYSRFFPKRERFEVNEENLRALISLSVKRRMISDVPIAFLYSGGLDSTIALNHCLESNPQIKVFTTANLDDTEYAEKYCKERGIEMKILETTRDKEDEDLYLKGEMLSDLGSFIPNYYLFKAVKEEGFRVCMTGDAADEVFSGYKRNFDLDFQKNDIYNELIYYHFPRLDKTAMMNTVEYRTPYSMEQLIDFALMIPYKERIDKKILRKAYKGTIPDYILERGKKPLKSDQIRNNKEEERMKLAKLWSTRLFDKFIEKYADNS